MHYNFIIKKWFCPIKKFNLTNFYTLTISVFVFLMILVIIIFPEKFIKSIPTGLTLFYNFVLPSLFPFLFLTKILTDLHVVEKISTKLEKFFQRVFKVPGISCYVFIMSILCGYPVGVKILSDLVTNQCIDKKTAEKILPFASTSGPLFLIGTCGFAMFENKVFGLLLLVSHIGGTLLSCLVFSIFNKKGKAIPSPTKQTRVGFDSILSNAAYSSVSSILLVGTFVSMFFLVIDILTEFSILKPLEFCIERILLLFNQNTALSQPITTGTIELTRGLFQLASLGTSKDTLIIASMLVSFGGLSILIQSLAFLNNSKISCKKFLITKIVQSICTVIICFVVCNFLS